MSVPLCSIFIRNRAPSLRSYCWEHVFQSEASGLGSRWIVLPKKMLGSTSQEQSKARIAHDVCAVLEPTRCATSRHLSSPLLPRHFQMRARNRSHQPDVGGLRRSSIALASRFWRAPSGLISPNLWVPLDGASAPCASPFPQGSKPFPIRRTRGRQTPKGGILVSPAGVYYH